MASLSPLNTWSIFYLVHLSVRKLIEKWKDQIDGPFLPPLEGKKQHLNEECEP